MGGAKCSYRTCTVKTDRKTHLFHFPVFDKIRCHQWITNAQKLNFLNLKLSQLKNRMICEHHFTDDCFMNDMMLNCKICDVTNVTNCDKEGSINHEISVTYFMDDPIANDASNVTRAKLKNTAIPTENGPFCSPAKDDVKAEDGEKEIPINLDDIEIDYLTNIEKKAHFSVKYGDFLTNDVTEPITLTPSYKSTSIMLKDSGLIFNRHNDRILSYMCNPPKNLSSFKNDVETNKFDTKAKDTLTNEKNESEESLYQNNPLHNPKVMSIKFEELSLNTNKEDKKPNETLAVVAPEGFAQTSVFPSHQVKPTTTPISQNKKLKIISEKKFTGPVKICKSELQPVSPSVVIKVPDRKKKTNVELNRREINTFYVDMATNQQQMDYVQAFDNSGIISSQPTVTDQMCLLTDYNQPTLLSNTVEGPNNLGIQNAELLAGSKEISYNITSKDFNRTQLSTDIEPIQMVPDVEFVSTSLTGPSVFTLTDVPQVTTTPHLVDSGFVPHNDSVAPTEVMNTFLVSTKSEVLPGTPVNTEYVTSVVKNGQNVAEISTNTQSNHLNKKPISVQSRSFLKSKMPPEKLAAIEEKRKFNMKLRDIINSCLSKLDEESDASKLTATMKRELNDKKVGEHLSSDCGLPTSQENIIAYLEARLQRMEDSMLSKIEQNSHRITDLKKTVIKSLPRKKSASTQTYVNSKSIKKNLYQQISQFLTPEANSLIYEELFLNDCVTSKIEPSPKKRKRK